VRPGEKLLLTVDVLEARRATSKPTLGIVRWRWIMRNELSDIVLELEATSLFDLGASTA
jgi:acyl dehydratase